MKGFTKDGKFRPTGRTKSGLKKSDITKSTRKEVKEGGKTFVKYNYFGKHSAKYEKRTKQSMDDTKELWNNSDDEKRERLLRNAYEELDFPSPLIDSNTGEQIGSNTTRDQLDSIVMIHSKTDYDELPRQVKEKLDNLVYWKRSKHSMDEEDIPVLEMERLDDIMEPIGNMNTGEINFNQLEKAVEENVMEILKREKFPTDVTVHFQEVREETGQDEFKRTGEGESGHYQYMFNIYKNKNLKVEDIIYRGVAYGSIQAGEMLDMEVDVYNH